MIGFSRLAVVLAVAGVWLGGCACGGRLGLNPHRDDRVVGTWAAGDWRVEVRRAEEGWYEVEGVDMPNRNAVSGGPITLFVERLEWKRFKVCKVGGRRMIVFNDRVSGWGIANSMSVYSFVEFEQDGEGLRWRRVPLKWGEAFELRVWPFLCFKRRLALLRVGEEDSWPGPMVGAREARAALVEALGADDGKWSVARRVVVASED